MIGSAMEEYEGGEDRHLEEAYEERQSPQMTAWEPDEYDGDWDDEYEEWCRRCGETMDDCEGHDEIQEGLA